ncbi:succinylglutamate desuccinylase [Chitiniphilus eburneus]|uniref:Succinylglutamate desuccinylase n=1 Tax=Chitiniphilus eburneus TaxID=2571148 RepID=A0A4V6WI85_9NEIS|nr:succinylglutamate desuccinylase [Chitiniphilus eburneus]TJZ73568.1 succinylglutamate desuccinylase [Chitiniphilus eburneus]
MKPTATPSFLEQTLSGKTAIGLPYKLPGGVNVQVMDEGVIRFEPRDSAHRKLDLVISCGVHGNETAPVELADALISELMTGALKVRARVLFVFGNIEALRRGVRFVESDMNRLFCRLPESHDGPEARRATMLEMQLMRFFARAMQDGKPRLHYDLHTAIHGSLIEKFAIYPVPPEGKRFDREQIARLGRAGVSAVLLQSARAPTFSYFSSQHCDAVSFTVELGRARPFGQNGEVDLSAMKAYLRHLIEGRIPAGAGRGDAPTVFRVSREVMKRSDAFELKIDGKTDNFTPLPQGMLLAADGESECRVEEADARIVFPNPDVVVGQRAGLIVVPDSATA